MEDQSESTPKGVKLHHVVNRPTNFKGWSVQLLMPVDNPVYNVRMFHRKGVYTFEVPMNYPNVHNIGFEELFQAQARSKKFTQFTDINNSIDTVPEPTSMPK